MSDGEEPHGRKRDESVEALQDKLRDAYAPEADLVLPPSSSETTADAGLQSAMDRQAASPQSGEYSIQPAPDTLFEPQVSVAARRVGDVPTAKGSMAGDGAEIMQAVPKSAAGRSGGDEKLFQKLLSNKKQIHDHTAAPRLPRAIYVSSFFINFLALALPLVILQVYDRILPNQATETLTILVLGLVGVLILDTAMKIARAYMVGWVTARHEYSVSNEAVSRILNTPSAKMESDAPSVHLDRINALDAMREFYGGQSRLLLLDLPFVFVFLGLMGLIGGYIVIVPIVLFLVLGAVSIIRGSVLRQVLETRAQHDDRRYDFIIESLVGVETVKALAMEPQIQRRFERLQKIGASASHDTILLGNEVQIIGVLFSNMAMICVVTVGAFMVIHGQLTMGTLAACTLLSGRTIQPLLKGLGLWTQLQRLSVARERIAKLFENRVVDKHAGNAISGLDGAVSLTGVSFSYGPDKPLILKNINLDIAPGEMIGLRGGDGSGKSTLLKLIRGELQPTAGQVRIDHFDPALVERASISDWLAYVPKDASIFRGTILENITMFRSGEAIDNAREAAQMIGLEADIHRLPAGYDMVLSEGITEELPAGLIQRIVIARALARKPKILLFDEGNASLDSRSDALLRQGFEQIMGDTTILLASLRPSMLRMASKVYSVLDGQLYDVTVEYQQTAAVPAAGDTPVASPPAMEAS